LIIEQAGYPACLFFEHPVPITGKNGLNCILLDYPVTTVYVAFNFFLLLIESLSSYISASVVAPPI